VVALAVQFVPFVVLVVFATGAHEVTVVTVGELYEQVVAVKTV
jgi:hypothetical protein